MVDTNGDGDVGKLQVIKYIETRTHIDKPDYIERANEYFDQEMGMKNLSRLADRLRESLHIL